MPRWSDLALPVLAISNVSGDSYGEIEAPELLSELRRIGHDPNPIALYNLMFQLRDDGYIMEFSTSHDFDKWALIRLDSRGRQQVQGWPRQGQATESDFEALIAVLRERADDPVSAPAEYWTTYAG